MPVIVPFVDVIEARFKMPLLFSDVAKISPLIVIVPVSFCIAIPLFAVAVNLPDAFNTLFFVLLNAALSDTAVMFAADTVVLLISNAKFVLE